MFCAFRSLLCSRETIRENLAVTRCMIAVERLKDYVVATLCVRCPVPGAMKCNENAVTVPRRELLLVIFHHGIRRPVGRKSSYGSEFARANTHGFAPVSSVFRREDQFSLKRIVVALGPAIVATCLQQHQLFRWESRFLVGPIEIRPIRVQ